MDRITKAATEALIEVDNGIASILEECAIAAANMTQAEIISMLTTLANGCRAKAKDRALTLDNG